MVIGEELIGTTKYLTVLTGCRTNRYHYNRALLYFDKTGLSRGLSSAVERTV
jgi:hypothetical protein